MNREIMSLPNELTYSGKLTCGNLEIEEATLQKFLKTTPLLMEDYLFHALSPEIMDSVCFLDTDKILDGHENVATVSTKETEGEKGKSGLFGSKHRESGYVHNEFEAKLIVRIVHRMLELYGSGGLTPGHIGVVSPFRKQVQRIKELMGDELVLRGSLEINTVDQYQGRDKEVIIYSCVKSFVQVEDSGIEKSDEESQLSEDSATSGGSGSSGGSTLLRGVFDSELLKDERRLNVAITRAKKKLIIVGNRSTLNRYEPFRNLFGVMRESMFFPLCNDIKGESCLL